ncbi:hypothetical protein QVD17_30394 [Tagetes erecta]|uniref:Uncharacterized protein n=1 Tax=Tagetes erecta TaxID=13708 RepID=A0AAD8NFZ0_TARER|nr:hypothetical protein QVD17_30394 [Tagetes erecta]
MSAQNDVCIPVSENKTEHNEHEEDFDYSQRGQWLRAAVLGATDGLVSVASLMMGVGAVKHDVRAMILTGFAGLVAGACSMAIGEFVSVHSQRDVEVAQMKRESQNDEESNEKEALPNPIQAAAASALAFMLGAIVPLLAAAFIVDHTVRLGVVVSTVSLALVFFGWIGAVLGRAPVVKSCFRILVGGWMAMAITFGLTKWIGCIGLCLNSLFVQSISWDALCKGQCLYYWLKVIVWKVVQYIREGTFFFYNLYVVGGVDCTLHCQFYISTLNRLWQPCGFHSPQFFFSFLVILANPSLDIFEANLSVAYYS